jgi:hypothetical protein
MSRGDPQFLNVDLDLESAEPLDGLADSSPSLIVMFSGRKRRKYFLSLELNLSGLTLDQTLMRWTKLISSLSGERLRIWQTASKRCFNIGFASGRRYPGEAGGAMSAQSSSHLDQVRRCRNRPRGACPAELSGFD